MIRARANQGRSELWRRHLPALVLLAGILLALTYAHAGRADETLPDPGYVVTATSPTTGLTDGQLVTINVKSRSSLTFGVIEVHQCKVGGTYASGADLRGAAGNCPDTGVSSSADKVVQRQFNQHLDDALRSPNGANLAFRVGVGSARFNTGSASSPSITCDPTHNCVLVVELAYSAGGQSHIDFAQVPLGFADSAAAGACGGNAPGAIPSAGADQLQELWSQWTRAACQVKGAKGSPTSVVFSGDGLAVQGFAGGVYDLAYTGAGYDPAVGLVTSDGTTPRSAVNVPVALDAAVIAVGGGETRGAPTWDKIPYPEVKLTAAQAATIFAGALATDAGDPIVQGISTLNPAFHTRVNQPGVAIQGPAEAESSTWYLTNYFKNQAPGAWADPIPPRAARGADAAFGTAVPPFPTLSTFSARSILHKNIDLYGPQNFSADGPIWIATDLATATAMGLTPVSIQNANGDFVAPTPASMAAAVPTMKPNANGVLIPDPAAVATTGDAVQPYPLTYVQYAMAPAEPLVDDSCTLKPDSQALIQSWLTFVTGDGQKSVAAGMQPLTPGLLANAKTRIPLVGAATVSGPCAGKVKSPGGGTGTTTTTTASKATSTNAPAAGGTSTGGGSTGSSGRSSSRGSSGSRSTPTTAPVVGESALGANQAAPTVTRPPETVLASVPAFAGRRITDSTDGVLALLGIVLITSLAAWITAGNGSPTVGSIAGGGAKQAAATGRPGTGALIALWLGVAITSFGLVVYQLGPVFQQRDQRSLLSQYRVEVKHAAAESQTLAGVQGIQAVSKPPTAGSAVGVLDIGALKTQNVVVEGVSPADTEKGSGHVPGTAGLGQPGNSVVVSRRNAYGGAFSDLSNLRVGSRILVTTTQGQSVYAVCSVGARTIAGASASRSDASSSPASSASGGSSTSTDTIATTAPPCPKPKSSTAAKKSSTSTTTTAPGATATTAPGDASSTTAPTTTAAPAPSSSAQSAAATVTSSKIRALSVRAEAVDQAAGPSTVTTIPITGSTTPVPAPPSIAPTATTSIVGATASGETTAAPTATTAAGTGTTAAGTATTAAGGVTTTTRVAAKGSTTAKAQAGGTIAEDALYGPSTDDRLTLITSGSRAPWNASGATVVIARMVGKPFPHTAQGARSNGATGRSGDSGVWAAAVLVLILYAAMIVGSVLLYQRLRFRVAYVLTIAPIVALTVLAGGTLSRLLPAWT